MASHEEFAPNNADFNICRGPSFRDLLEAAHFNRKGHKGHLTFRFDDNDKRSVHFGRLVGQIFGYASFTLLIFENWAEGMKRTYVIYDAERRVGLVFEPKSLQDLLDFEYRLRNVDLLSTKWGKNG